MLYCEVAQDLEDKLKQLRDENSALKDEKSVLKDENSALKDEKSVLKDENSVLKDEVERLKKVEKEFEELKINHKRAVDNLRKSLKVKSDKKPSKQSKKRRGAPKGHKGGSFKVPEATAEKKHSLDKCPHCSSELGKAIHSTRKRVITDIEPVTPAVTTKHIIPRKYCPSCDRIVEPVIAEALPHANIGLNLMIWVFYMKVVQRSSCDKVRDYLKEQFGFETTNGGVVNIINQLKKFLGVHEKQFIKLFRNSKTKYTDSTGWRIAGKNFYVWVFVTKAAAFYKVFSRNNHKGPLRILGKAQRGKILVTDRHSACLKLAKEAKMLSQCCWSHLTQDSKELAQYYPVEGLEVHKEIKKIYKKAKTLEQQYHSGQLKLDKTEEAIEKLKERITTLREKHYKSLQVRKFLKNIVERDFNNLFRFITTDADSTNNISERTLRHLVIARRISYGSNTRKGANATLLLHSIYQTLKIQTNNFQTTNIHTELKKLLTPTTQS